MSASIIIVSGPGEGDYYPLGDHAVVVGRDEDVDIQVLDDLVSRRHLQISPQDGGYNAWDMNSSNGVFINGRQITVSTPLANGDLIDVGETKMMFASKEFPDKKSAWDYYKLSGERGKSTLIQ